MRFFDAESSELIVTLDLSDGDPGIEFLVYSPSGDNIAVANVAGKLHITDARTKTTLQTVQIAEDFYAAQKSKVEMRCLQW